MLHLDIEPAQMSDKERQITRLRELSELEAVAEVTQINESKIS